jgi:hypothetical protein
MEDHERLPYVCQICCRRISSSLHAASMAARTGLDKKSYEALEKDLELHTRRTGPGEADSDGNPVVCPGCIDRSLRKTGGKRS